jgi:hypothetical protein
VTFRCTGELPRFQDIFYANDAREQEGKMRCNDKKKKIET